MSTSSEPGDGAATAERGGSPAEFKRLFSEVMATAERFGHREHIRLTWLAVRRHGTEAAIGLMSDGIRGLARSAGTPEKYHTTITRAWVELVAIAAAQTDAADFDVFIAEHPELLDKQLLTRHYRPSTLASEAARGGWVEPDLAPLR